MPNFIEIGWEITEKSSDAGELERKIRKYNKKKKKQNNNRKVFRRCRQTFNKRELAGKFKLQLSVEKQKYTDKHMKYSYQVGREREGGGVSGFEPNGFFLVFLFVCLILTKPIRTEPTSGYVWVCYFLELNL